MITYKSIVDACFWVEDYIIKLQSSKGEIKTADFPNYIEAMLLDNYKNTAFIRNGVIVFDLINITPKKVKEKGQRNKIKNYGISLVDTPEEYKPKSKIKKRIKFTLCQS